MWQLWAEQGKCPQGHGVPILQKHSDCEPCWSLSMFWTQTQGRPPRKMQLSICHTWCSAPWPTIILINSNKCFASQGQLPFGKVWKKLGAHICSHLWPPLIKSPPKHMQFLFMALNISLETPWSSGPMLSKQESLSWRLSQNAQQLATLRVFHNWISWSFAALLKGKHPTKGPSGEALPLPLSSLAGQSLTLGNHRCVIWSIQGDQEFFSNTLFLPHWQNRFPCHQCDGQKPVWKGKHCPPGKSIKLLKEDEQQFVCVSPEAALLDKVSPVH